MIYDLIIIGGGPAGVAAGIYASRKRIKSVLITDYFGGQSSVSADIQNWIGVKSISGFNLAKTLEEHLRAQDGIEIVSGDLVEKIEKIPVGWRVITRSKKIFEAKYLLIATGSRRRKLEVPGGIDFEGRGIVYCATCDAPLFKEKVVAVVGGGNAGLETTVDLLPYASKIYVLEKSLVLRGDVVTIEKVKSSPKVEVITGAEVTEVVGDDFVRSIKYKNQNGEIKELKVDGVFVEIGSVPNSDIVKDFVKLNERGEIIVDPKTQVSSESTIWAAGDVTDGLYKQNNISVGDAIKAVLNIAEVLAKNQTDLKF